MHENALSQTEDGAVHTELPSGRRLYIMKPDVDRSAYENVPDSVLVLDDRDIGNPSFQMLQSRTIRTLADKREIPDAIIVFDPLWPSATPWKRSMDLLVKK